MSWKNDKKEKYIRQVCRNLQLSHEMKKRVESDLRTDIELRLESGKDMDAVIRELGTPKEAAKYFNEEMTESGRAKFSGLSWVFLAAAVVTVVLFLHYYTSTHSYHQTLDEAVSVVGSVDGPASVFIAGRVSSSLMHWIWGIVFFISFLAAFFLCTGWGKRRRNYIIAGILSVAGILFSLVGIIFHLSFFERGNTIQVILNLHTLFSRKNTLLMLLSLILVFMLVIALRKRKK